MAKTHYEELNKSIDRDKMETYRKYLKHSEPLRECHIPPISELLGENNQIIVDPAGIRNQIDKHIEEILHGPNTNRADAQFQEHLNQTRPEDDCSYHTHAPDIIARNGKRKKSKLRYFLHRKIKNSTPR